MGPQQVAIGRKCMTSAIQSRLYSELTHPDSFLRQQLTLDQCRAVIAHLNHYFLSKRPQARASNAVVFEVVEDTRIHAGRKNDG